MGSRLELHNELLQFVPNVYFQPPSDHRMTFPCIVYGKASRRDVYAADDIYKIDRQYQLQVIESDPDSDLVDRVINHFRYASIGTNFVKDNIYHTSIKLYF